jgi:putative transposase
VERLIGTFMRRTHLLPGNTYSDMLGRRPKHAETQAHLSLSDYRWFLIGEIDHYHKSSHRTLCVSPRTAWERAWARNRGTETPPTPARRQQFKFDFLPVRRRVVSREGIEIEGLKFSHPQLQAEIEPTQKRVVRLDPRDLSRVYLEMHDSSYLVVPLQRKDLPSMSWWEWRAIRRRERLHSMASSERPESFGYLSAPTPLRRRRLAARKTAWAEIQKLQALPTKDTSLKLIEATEPAGDLPGWELLE